VREEENSLQHKMASKLLSIARMINFGKQKKTIVGCLKYRTLNWHLQ
jgi:hypothetical protein